MMSCRTLVALFALCCIALAKDHQEHLAGGPNFQARKVDARGFNDNIDWIAFPDAQIESARTKKPLMLLIYKSWCNACKKLKPQIAESTEIVELSQHFVMSQVMDDEEPDGHIYAPDGGYIPRILFFDYQGGLMEVINTGGNPEYKYYYSKAQDVINAMHWASTFHKRHHAEEYKAP
eukprot:TRINITY_DN67949_c5_g7_i1.p1 TRINITY_DN67949_c5_g7~~TRINITY_DN67949_c5_g7_i1.p1  ORF type:complete len:177 (-),score=23.15 TRINITY_DN67949_c5_g7_i1:89-619(-)